MIGLAGMYVDSCQVSHEQVCFWQSPTPKRPKSYAPKDSERKVVGSKLHVQQTPKIVMKGLVIYVWFMYHWWFVLQENTQHKTPVAKNARWNRVHYAWGVLSFQWTRQEYFTHAPLHQFLVDPLNKSESTHVLHPTSTGCGTLVQEKKKQVIHLGKIIS